MRLINSFPIFLLLLNLCSCANNPNSPNKEPSVKPYHTTKFIKLEGQDKSGFTLFEDTAQKFVLYTNINNKESYYRENETAPLKPLPPFKELDSNKYWIHQVFKLENKPVYLIELGMSNYFYEPFFICLSAINPRTPSYRLFLPFDGSPASVIVKNDSLYFIESVQEHNQFDKDTTCLAYIYPLSEGEDNIYTPSDSISVHKKSAKYTLDSSKIGAY